MKQILAGSACYRVDYRTQALLLDHDPLNKNEPQQSEVSVWVSVETSTDVLGFM